MSECEHKYVFARNDSFWYTNGRYAKVFVSLDYFFCEKCLNEEMKRKQANVGDHETPPDWARTTTKQVPGL
jgi:hypothetical protein